VNAAAPVKGDRDMPWIVALLRRMANPVRPPGAPDGGLGECRRCRRHFVNPVQWHERDESRWWMRLRCGECGFVREAVVTDDDAVRFDRELDRGVDEIAALITRLDRARMAAEADAFAIALERDLVDAGDFGA
jgi:hypothetical protein